MSPWLIRVICPINKVLTCVLLSGHFVAKNIPDVSFNKNIVSLEILISKNCELYYEKVKYGIILINSAFICN